MSSPDSLLDAEGDVNSNIEDKPWPKIGPATQETDFLYNREATDGSQASGFSGHPTKPCPRENSLAHNTSHAGVEADQKADQTAEALEPELSKQLL